ncbi:MAG: hypothetical protein E6R14_08635 [Thermomicrobiales bacterium]|jgi:hypothetical protein|nr:MAG: hypothetical protein E6R14_08635 [Thermomicrobiales bacterium]
MKHDQTVSDLPRVENAKLPPRCALYALKPIGLGTPECESLAGYLFRLACAHCLSALDLAWYVIRDALTGKVPSNKEDFQPWRDRMLSGVSDMPVRWAKALSKLTSIKHLELLTLAPWADVLSARGLIHQQQRWCPACFEDAHREQAAPYLRLAWDIAAVEACPTHGTLLVAQCPKCDASCERTKVACPVPGYCSACGAWLGQSSDTLSAATAEQLHAAQQVGAVIAGGPTRAASASAAALRTAIHAGIEQEFRGVAASLGAAIGQPKHTVHMWLKKDTLPTLSSQIAMAKAFRMPLLELMAGNASAIGTLAVPRPEAVSRAKTRDAPRTLDWEAVEAQLRELSQHTPPISAAEAASRVGVAKRTLATRLQPLIAEISSRYAKHVARQAAEALEQKTAVVGATVQRLVEQGIEPTRRNMVEALDGTLPFAGAVVWKAWQAAREDVAESGN